MTKKKSKKVKKNAMSSEKQFLLTLIKYTERNIKNDGSELDLVFMEQTKKLKRQLEETK